MRDGGDRWAIKMGERASNEKHRESLLQMGLLLALPCAPYNDVFQTKEPGKYGAVMSGDWVLRNPVFATKSA